ncbi:hypothetical protein N7449_007889 [Penicillium cf. viridicatum]|uniref:Uncharacterized protein n=1 Tax=Penicillium cf. viridicatum TaxID=2972119 RepID=A0A9W9MCH5_9EURO|nr:hypothetical protein N7449_007889 [Penicillium cf. viridicatum]
MANPAISIRAGIDERILHFGMVSMDASKGQTSGHIPSMQRGNEESTSIVRGELTNRDMIDMDCSREWPNLHVELRRIDLCTLNEDPAAALRLR